MSVYIVEIVYCGLAEDRANYRLLDAATGRASHQPDRQMDITRISYNVLKPISPKDMCIPSFLMGSILFF